MEPPRWMVINEVRRNGKFFIMDEGQAINSSILIILSLDLTTFKFNYFLIIYISPYTLVLGGFFFFFFLSMKSTDLFIFQIGFEQKVCEAFYPYRIHFVMLPFKKYMGTL